MRSSVVFHLPSIATALLAWTAGPGLGQTTFATLTGVVTDPNGSLLPAVEMQAVHVATGYRYTAQTNEVGVYTLSQLREGQYTLRANVAGFKEFIATGLRLVALDVRRLDVQLQVGPVEVRVEVSAQAGLIETETARISATRSSELMKTLPLNTRSLSSFMYLVPTVVVGTGARTRFAGSGSLQENYAIDGISVNSHQANSLGSMLSYMESHEELRVDTVNNTAEFGTVGQVSIISKSGGNQLHGAVFDYYNSGGLNARNPFQLTRSSGVTHWPGVNAGGPLWLPKIYDGRNKTFWFLSYETQKGSVRRSLLNPTVPPQLVAAGRFFGSRHGDPGSPGGQPGLPRQPDSGDKTQPDLLADAGAVLAIAELRQHRGVLGQQLPDQLHAAV